MSLPEFNGECALYQSSQTYAGSGGNLVAGKTAVVPQACLCTPCVQVGGSPYCVTLFGRRICLPALGRWKGCCCTKWTPPFIGCSINRC